MKHPAFRCSDILYVHPDWRAKVFDFVESLRDSLHPFIRDNMARFELCGSQAFGNAKLRSDWDFNIAMKNWEDQVTARRLYRGNIGPYRSTMGRSLEDFKKKYGLEISIGCVDCDTQKYNINVSLDDMILHHRYSVYPEFLYADSKGIIWESDDRPISLKTFDFLKDPVPPVADIHLQWNGDMWRWQRIPLDGGSAGPLYIQNKQQRAKWAVDEWADIVPDWQTYYGKRFMTHHRVGTELFPD